MSRAIGWVLGFAVIAAFGCAAAVGDPQGTAAGRQKPTASPADVVEVGEFLIVEPVRSKNLAVFPVLSKLPKDEDRYITLEEGLKSGKVQVYEIQEADVNHLMVVNRSDKLLFLMPGEIIYGGQQDRCVAEECIIPADGKPVKVEVYCVEHGRWSYRQETETQAALGSLAADANLDEQARRKLTEETRKGKFVLQAGNLTKAGRAAVQEGKGQDEVWKQVGKLNAASGAQTATSTFTANYTNPEITKRITPYMAELEKPVADRLRVVGAMVAVDGKMESVDVFGSTPLFRKVWPKLLKSHALDASVAAEDEKSAKNQRVATLEDAERFFRAAMDSDVKQATEGKGGVVVTKRESANVVSYSSSDKSRPAAMGGMGGGFGGVHGAGFSK